FLFAEILPHNWTFGHVYGEEEANRMEEERKKVDDNEDKEKAKSDEEKKKEREEEEEVKRKKEEEEKKRKKEEDRNKKEEERKKKEEEKEKERKKKTSDAAAGSSESESESSEEEDEDEEKTNRERDLFIAQLYKYHEERNTPINKAPCWGGMDLDLHRFYRLVVRYGGFKKVCDSNRWKRILSKLGLDASGVQPINLKKAYSRYLEDFHSTYVQLGWSLDLLSTKLVSGGRSAKKVIDYGY
ncbi:hypothetical protein PFISCL1PPCAC_3635, partial [Pristionchus fissidentatus]